MRCDCDQHLMVLEHRRNYGRRFTYLWAAFMPFALKGSSGHVGSRGSSFDGGALLGGYLVHHAGG